jgi:hypothetical protein
MSELKNTLQSLHEALQGSAPLAAEDRRLLETVLDDIQRVLHSGSGVESATSDHGDALESVAVRLEAGHPGVATAIRAVLDALAKAGI